MTVNPFGPVKYQPKGPPNRPKVLHQEDFSSHSILLSSGGFKKVLRICYGVRDLENARNDARGESS